MSKLSNYVRHVKATKVLTDSLDEKGIRYQISYTSTGRVVNTANTVFVLGVRQDNVIEGLIRIEGQTFNLLATDDTLKEALSTIIK